MSAEANLRDIIKLEFKKCYSDPIYFMIKYCVIQHPQRGKIPFKLYPYQQDVLKSFQHHDYNVILKSRQLGISTLCAAYALWYMIFHSDKNILVLATKQDVAKNLVTKVRVMNENLPTWLKVVTTEDNKLSLRFKNGSQIKATTTSSDSGRSEACSVVIVDECCDGRTIVKVKHKTTDEVLEITIADLFNMNKK
jgi:phage terminase large subunit-like protein